MTKPAWQLHEDRASAAQILAHLARCDARFVPPLSVRVDLPAYAARLHDRARRFEAWSEGELVGLVAVYFDGGEGTAFISNVSVEEGFLGRGIASALVTHAIERAGAAGLCRVRLEVGVASTAARRLYEKLGFQACPGEGEQVLMQLDLPGTLP
jgi:ribosomal protein S18 acetylase RimI-like enzyme